MYTHAIRVNGCSEQQKHRHLIWPSTGCWFKTRMPSSNGLLVTAHDVHGREGQSHWAAPSVQGDRAADQESGRRQNQLGMFACTRIKQKCPPQINGFTTNIWPSGLKLTQLCLDQGGSVGWSAVPQTGRSPVPFPVQGTRLGCGFSP